MSARGWTGSVALAAGLAAATGAAQLGVGYGLGIIGWLGDAAGWAAALAWTVWVAALSVAVAALAAHRRTTIVESVTPWSRALWRASVACAAALGGLAVVPLTALPAREVATAATFAPAWVVGWYATAGVLVGLVLAIVALASRAVAANLVATASWWWLVAVMTVIDAVAAGRGLAPTQLGVWRFTRSDAPTDYEAVPLQLPGSGWWQSIYLPGAALTLGAAFIIGLLAALPAGRRGEARAAVALSGVVGPVLLAGASVLAAPRLGGAPAEQVSALLVAPYAVLAGLAGSVLAALITVTRTEGVAAEPATQPVPQPEPQPVSQPVSQPEDAAVPRARRHARPRAVGKAAVGKAAVPEQESGGQSAGDKSASDKSATDKSATD